jgi:hypothetical protein
VYALTVILVLATVALLLRFRKQEPFEIQTMTGRAFLVLASATLLSGYYVLSYSAAILVVPALRFLGELAHETGRRVIIWSLLLDVLLLAPGLTRVLMLFFAPSDLTLLILPNQALFFALVSAMLAGVLIGTARQPSVGRNSSISTAVSV